MPDPWGMPCPVCLIDRTGSAQLSRRACDATHMASLSEPSLAGDARGLVIRQPQLMGEHWRYTSLVVAPI
jgi:hypothetical protein